jgi:predicted permease
MIQANLEALPGVTSVGSSSSVPMDDWGSGNPLFVEDFPEPEGQIPPLRRFDWVGGGYFETLDIPILAGRPLSWQDSRDLNRVVVVSRNLARELWGDASAALGKRVGTGLAPGDWMEIVGVVGDVHESGPDRAPPAMVYWPALSQGVFGATDESDLMIWRSMVFSVRSSRVGSAALSREVRDAAWAVNPNLPLGSMETMPDIMQAATARTSFTLVMVGIAAMVALLLGTIGIYGVVAYTVTQRNREIGVRLALGAGEGAVAGMVLRQGMVLAGAGIALGLVCSLGITRLMGSLLYGVSATDPLTFAVVALTLWMVALTATWIPARRAAATDPVDAIRNE